MKVPFCIISMHFETSDPRIKLMAHLGFIFYLLKEI